MTVSSQKFLKPAFQLHTIMWWIWQFIPEEIPKNCISRSFEENCTNSRRRNKKNQKKNSHRVCELCRFIRHRRILRSMESNNLWRWWRTYRKREGGRGATSARTLVASRKVFIVQTIDTRDESTTEQGPITRNSHQFGDYIVQI